MKAREVAVILATGGMGLVRAAYSAGKPAYGVGPGNAPCYIERSADLQKAARDIMIGKTFDNGLLCSSPNSVVVDESIAEEARRQFQTLGAYFMNDAEADALARVLVTRAAAAEPGARRQARLPDRGEGRAEGSRRDEGPDCTAEGRRTRLPVVDREALPRPLLVCRERLAPGVRALHRDPALRRDGSHDGHPFGKPGRDPSVRAQEACVPDLRQHADDARIDWADHRPRSGDDAGMRRLGRQHHVGQHLAAASAEHQTAGVRSPPRRPVGDDGKRDRASTGRPSGRPKRSPRRTRFPKRPPVPEQRGISAQALSATNRRVSRRRGATQRRRRRHATDSAKPSAVAAAAAEPAVRAPLSSCAKTMFGPRCWRVGSCSSGRRRSSPRPHATSVNRRRSSFRRPGRTEQMASTGSLDPVDPADGSIHTILHGRAQTCPQLLSPLDLLLT